MGDLGLILVKREVDKKIEEWGVAKDTTTIGVEEEAEVIVAIEIENEEEKFETLRIKNYL